MGRRTFLSLFMKSPDGNSVKTRLLPAFSKKEVASLYRAFVQDMLEILAVFPCDMKVVCYSGEPPSRRLLPSRSREITFLSQQGTHLGERMKNYFDWSFAQGAEKSVVIGSDSPTLPRGYLSEAFSLLERYEVVIGPSVDGGYYLIGMRKFYPELFENIPWGSDLVLERTIFQNRYLAGKFALLELWYDIDTPEDLSFLKRHLHWMRQDGERGLPKRTCQALSELEV